MPLSHVALTVHDRERSAAFYARWFGLARRVHEDDHLLILGADGEDSLLAFKEGTVPSLPPENHFGFQVGSGDEVRSARERFAAAGVAETEWQDSHGFVRVQVRDPDGYQVELFALST